MGEQVMSTFARWRDETVRGAVAVADDRFAPPLVRLLGVAPAEWERLGIAGFGMRRIEPGLTLFDEGQVLRELYLVYSGGFKLACRSAGMQQQVLGFAWRGELLGADGLPRGRYTHSAVALVDAWVHVLPYAVLRSTMARLPGFAARWREALSAQERRANDNAWVLEAHAAEARLARFVIALARRMAELGCSQRHLLLEMTQRDIANHLSLSADGLERAYAGLDRAGLLRRPDLRHLDVIDPRGLRRVASEAGDAWRDSLDSRADLSGPGQMVG